MEAAGPLAVEAGKQAEQGVEVALGVVTAAAEMEAGSHQGM